MRDITFYITPDCKIFGLFIVDGKQYMTDYVNCLYEFADKPYFAVRYYGGVFCLM
jgi:hypothetical protein